MQLANNTTNRTRGERKNNVLKFRSNPPSRADQPDKPKPKRIRKPPILRAAERAALTVETAEAIMAAVSRRAAHYSNREQWPDELMRAEKRALEMAHCGDPSNHLAGYDYHKETATGDLEFYSGRAVLSCCAQPLCLTAIEKKRARLRKRALEAFEAYTFQTGERYYFLTLTVTKMPELSRVEAIRLQNKAFRRWQDSVFYIRNIRGGVRSVETTTKRVKPCKGECCADTKVASITDHSTGFHCHSHLAVVLSASAAAAIKKDFKAWRAELKASWTRAFQAECEKRGYEPPPADTYDGLYICHARSLTSKNPDSKSPIRDGLIEAIKYSLKADTIKNILKNDSQLLQVAGSRELVREGELFGCIREVAPDRRTVATRHDKRIEAAGRATFALLAGSGRADARIVRVLFLDNGCANAELVAQRARLSGLVDKPGFAAKCKRVVEISPVESDERYEKAREIEARALALRGIPEGPGEVLLDGRAVNESVLEGVLSEFGRGFAAAEIWSAPRDWALAVGDEIRSAVAVSRIGGSGTTKEAVEREKRREAGDDYLKRARRVSRIERDLRLSRGEYERNAFYDWTQKQGAAMRRLVFRYPWARFVTVSGEAFEGIWREERAAAVA